MTQRVEIPDGQVTANAIIAGALIAGASTLLAVVLFLVHVVGFDTGDTGAIMSFIGTGMILAEIVPFVLLDKFAAMNAANQAYHSQGAPGSMEERLGRYRVRMILRYALCEGACFLNITAYLLEQNWWTLIVVGGLILVMVAMFPTRTKVEHWIETQQMLSQTPS